MTIPRHKEKTSVILDKEIIRKIKELSLREGKSINAIIENAITHYYESTFTSNKIRREAADHFCSKPFNISAKELDDLIKIDFYK